MLDLIILKAWHDKEGKALQGFLQTPYQVESVIDEVFLATTCLENDEEHEQDHFHAFCFLIRHNNGVYKHPFNLVLHPSFKSVEPVPVLYIEVESIVMT